MDPVSRDQRSSASSSRRSDDATITIAAPTLDQALRLVRRRCGPDARLMGSRTVVRQAGLGEERVVEVTVAAPGGRPPVGGRRPDDAPAAKHRPGLPGDVVREVERIEALVDEIAAHQHRRRGSGDAVASSPVVEALVDGGASTSVTAAVLERYRAETGGDPGDRSALLAHLGSGLRTSGASWNDISGSHVFLGAEGAGKTELVLAVAARLQGLGRSVLVLSLLPRHGGEVRRLQQEASRHGYDAAILKQPRQLAASTPHLERYDVVLVDTPPLHDPALAESGELQGLVGQNATMHRHLVLPLDGDPAEIGEVCAEARRWNGDWVAFTRLDRSCRPGKLLDLLEIAGLPASLLASGPWDRREVEIATSGRLLDVMLGGDAARASVRREAATA
ncbi:MAG: hypothetical protein R6X25_08695 [Candidatus Krumholzibacteriia bacterium]